MVGRLNPNHIVPTAPQGTADNRAASTAFSSNAGNIVSGVLAVANGGTGAAKYNNCRIYLNSNQTGLASGSFSKINFDTVDFDPDGIADVATNHRITPNVAGTFLVTVGVDTNSAAATSAVIASIAKNGSRVRSRVLTATGATSETGNGFSDLVQMNGSTDFLEMQALVTTTGAVTWQANAGIVFTWLSCVRLSP